MATDWKRIGTAAATSGISELMRPGQKAAEAAGKAAEEQAAVAREALAFQKESRDLAMRAAEPTLDELNSISNMLKTRDQAMQFQLKNIDNQLTLLNSVDPALREAGTQAYQLLQGQEAKTLAPIKRQRELMRQQLKNTLSERLGSGYETSSAGIEALSRFDDDTSNVLLNAQQQTLGMLLGTATQVRPDMAREVGAFSDVVGGFDKSLIAAQQNITGRKISAITQTPVSFADVIGTAGSQYKADLFKAQAQQQNINQAIGVGTTLGAAALGGSAKGA